MFHRKRASSNPPRVVKSTPSAAASTAATQAFLANRASTANLSNAAAAAALRSHTTSPVNVGQIQTKRMQRRASVSSNADAPDRPGLQRRGSSGSLTERTFRDPSPSKQRPASAQASYTPYQQPPPVPALPQKYASPSHKAARRAASVEPPERVSSPPPRLPGGRGVSLDRGPGVMKSPTGALKPKLGTLDTVGELERPGNRNSVNFSRPMSPQNSPPASPLAGGRVRSPPPTKSGTVSGLPNGEAERILEAIQETATAPVKKKKKVMAKGLAEGSHLATGTVNGPAQGSALQVIPHWQAASTASTTSPSSTVSQASNTTEPPKPKKKKKKVIPGAPPTPDPSEGFGSAYPSDTDSVTSERSSTAERPRSYNTRAAGLLMKQPSIVREDREGEEQAENRVSAKKVDGQATQNGNMGVATPANTSKAVSHRKSASQVDTPERASLDIHVPGAARPQSLSPARAAHFSSKPEYETPGGAKHQPPARSVSPAKSALKYSSSPRGQSPALVAARLAPSEASDTASNMSDDGSRSIPKKRKSVRVSFDDDLVAVGRATSPPTSTDSPVILSPQNKPKVRSWFDLVREQKQEDEVLESNQDSVIKPTPILPSFGSIRGRPDEPVLDSTKEQKSSDDWARDTLRRTDTSSDEGVGFIIAQDAAAREKKVDAQMSPRQGPNDPLPPQVTSVEGSGYHSDDEANLFDDQKDKTAPPEDVPSGTTNATPDSSKTSTARTTSEEPNASIPSIALLPATPALESAAQSRTSWLGMPGGFPNSLENSEKAQSSAVLPQEHHSTEITPATLDLAEPEPEAAAHQHDPGSPHVGEVAEGLRAQIDSHSGDESEDAGGSIYSDAAEDPDDLDGDGFGSINAIIESPASPRIPFGDQSPSVSPSVKAPDAKAPQRSPLPRNESELSEPASDEGWDRAQAYWSGLSRTRKEQLEHAAQPGAFDEPAIPNKTMRGLDSVKKKKVVKKSTTPPDSNNAPLPPWPDRQYQDGITRSSPPRAAPAKSALRNSQVGSAQEPQMRSSMRNGPLPKSALKTTTQRDSAQPPPEPRAAPQKKNRPVSAVALVNYNKSQALPKHGHSRAVSAGGTTSSLMPVMAQSKKKTPATKPKMLRNDSDSSSSFRKTRPTTPSNNKYSMKRTMRPSSMDSGAVTGSLSARTSSPAGPTARRPFSSVGPGGGGMRTSMRDSMDSSKPASRTSLQGSSMDSKRTKSPSRFGFGKSKPKAVDSKPSSRFSSRLADSSDEEDARPSRSSRFADSSDDEPADFTPVRGIPRRIDEGDSTDLSDSSVEHVSAPSKAKMNGATAPINTKPEGVALATGSLRSPSGDGPTAVMGSGLQAKKAAEKDQKKRSFFGSLGSKKKADDPTRVRKPESESAARRDTPLERSRAERTGTSPTKINERVLGPSSPLADPIAQSPRPALGSRTSSAQNSPKSPKLQRRNTPKGVAPINNAKDIPWPLPQSPRGTVSTPISRPMTSDGPAGANGAGRPDMGRRLQSEGPSPQTAPLTEGKTEKKKRFRMLRKAFGLHD